MSYHGFRPYVPAAKRRLNAENTLKKLAKRGQTVSPVKIEGRQIAKSFWGKSWCDNLERYSDYANRLPRGRTYVRNGSVVDLQIAAGEIKAHVAGSELYTVTITIAPVAAARWKAVCKDCSGGIDSLVELLRGRLSKAVMDRVCRKEDGLFPAPKDIELSCSCPDWADMCKHVAAVLYGVGARLDEKPEHLFALRAVDVADLISHADQSASVPRKAPNAAKRLADNDVSALFGLEMAEPGNTEHGVAKPSPKRAPRRAAADAPPSPSKGGVAPAKRAARASTSTRTSAIKSARKPARKSTKTPQSTASLKPATRPKPARRT